MADLTITAANVAKVSGASTATGIAGTTITQGQALYADASDSDKLKLADSNSTAATAVCVGIALNSAASGQPVTYITAGSVTIGATVVLGMPYCTSNTAGGIRPITDAASTEYLTIIGYASTTAILTLNITNTNVALASDIT